MRLDDVPRELLVAIAIAALGWAIASAVRRGLRGAQRRRRFARGQEGEREAAALLEDAGWTIEGRRSRRSTRSRSTGRRPPLPSARTTSSCRRAASASSRRYKAGRAAPRLDTAGTRRQLLEYQHAFGVGGVLLVDADARTDPRRLVRAARHAGARTLPRPRGGRGGGAGLARPPSPLMGGSAGHPVAPSPRGRLAKEDARSAVAIGAGAGTLPPAGSPLPTATWFRSLRPRHVVSRLRSTSRGRYSLERLPTDQFLSAPIRERKSPRSGTSAPPSLAGGPDTRFSRTLCPLGTPQRRERPH